MRLQTSDWLATGHRIVVVTSFEAWQGSITIDSKSYFCRFQLTATSNNELRKKFGSLILVSSRNAVIQSLPRDTWKRYRMFSGYKSITNKVTTNCIKQPKQCDKTKVKCRNDKKSTSIFANSSKIFHKLIITRWFSNCIIVDHDRSI